MFCAVHAGVISSVVILISTMTLRVIGGDEKGSLKSETVKYGHEYHRTRTRENALERASSICKNRSILSSERAPQKNKTVTVKES
jgi:hypothetical protein